MFSNEFIEQTKLLFNGFKNAPMVYTSNPKQAEKIRQFIQEQLCLSIEENSNIDKKTIMDVIYIHGNPLILKKDKYSVIESFQIIKNYIDEQDFGFRNYFRQTTQSIFKKNKAYSEGFIDFWTNFFAESKSKKVISCIWNQSEEIALAKGDIISESLEPENISVVEPTTSKWLIFGKPALLVTGISAQVIGILGMLCVLSIPFSGCIALMAASILLSACSSMINQPIANHEVSSLMYRSH